LPPPSHSPRFFLRVMFMMAIGSVNPRGSSVQISNGNPSSGFGVKGRLPSIERPLLVPLAWAWPHWPRQAYFADLVGPNWGGVFFLGWEYPVVFKYSIPSKA
jgi:hypothetical protein